MCVITKGARAFVYLFKIHVTISLFLPLACLDAHTRNVRRVEVGFMIVCARARSTHWGPMGLTADAASVYTDTVLFVYIINIH